MDVLGLRARGTDFLLDYGENPDYVGGTAVVGQAKDLYRAGGTSFCAPIVAGTASLLWSLQPDLTLGQLKTKLLMSAEDIEIPGWDQYTGAGLLDARKAIQADPDYYLYTRISRLNAARRGGRTFIDVFGRVEGSEFSGRWLQIAPGEEPEREAWLTVNHSTEPVQDGLLGSIPTSRFTESGVWMVRILSQDKRRLVKQSRARLDLDGSPQTRPSGSKDGWTQRGTLRPTAMLQPMFSAEPREPRFSLKSLYSHRRYYLC